MRNVETAPVKVVYSELVKTIKGPGSFLLSTNMLAVALKLVPSK